MAQTVEMRIGNAVHQVTLNDNDAARSFAARLPLTLQFDDYAGTERIAYLNPKLKVGGAPTHTTPKTCDLTYYIPWGIWRYSCATFAFPKAWCRSGA